MKLYILKRNNGEAECLVQDQASGFKRLLEIGPSLKLASHSPTGFAFGYAGSGPAQLALAILLDYTGDEQRALRWHQDFKQAWIAGAQAGQIIGSTDLNDFLSTRA
jgi:hypothetical protein